MKPPIQFPICLLICYQATAYESDMMTYDGIRTVSHYSGQRVGMALGNNRGRGQIHPHENSRDPVSMEKYNETTH